MPTFLFFSTCRLQNVSTVILDYRLEPTLYCLVAEKKTNIKISYFSATTTKPSSQDEEGGCQKGVGGGKHRGMGKGWEGGCADTENVQNFTQAGLFVSRFYPKVRELRQF